MDLAVMGEMSTGEETTRIYRSESGAGLALAQELEGLHSGDLAWADYDGDGWLDLATCGNGAERSTFIYRNTGAGLVDSGISLPGFDNGGIAWGDYDNDGDLDLLSLGMKAGAVFSPGSNAGLTSIFRNDGAAGFTDTDPDLPFLWLCDVAWGDCDNDGDLDTAIMGSPKDCGGSLLNTSWGLCAVHLNDGQGVLSDADAGLKRMGIGSVAWGDYDADGDLDLVVIGNEHLAGSTGVATLYSNQGDGTFIDSGVSLTGVVWASTAWGDYDNDGDLDLALAGDGDADMVSMIYLNNGDGSFSDSGESIQGVGAGQCSVAWGDYDSDGDLDLAVAGGDDAVVPHLKIYENVAPQANSPPSVPTGLGVAVDGWDGSAYGVVFSWTRGSDAQTPQLALTHNLRVWTDDASVVTEVMPAHADPLTGKRRVPAMGNTQHNTSWKLHLPPGTYYWSVQAVDTAFAGSPWAPEQTLDLQPWVDILAPVGGDVWMADTVQKILWMSAQLTNVRIELSRNNGSTWEGVLYRTIQGGLRPAGDPLRARGRLRQQRLRRRESRGRVLQRALRPAVFELSDRGARPVLVPAGRLRSGVRLPRIRHTSDRA
jgi:hypothetical protein